MSLGANDLDLLEQWLEDPTFRAWASGTPSAAAEQWERYFQDHPGLRPLAQAGRVHLTGLPFAAPAADPDSSRAALDRLLHRLDAPPAATRFRRLRPLHLAAAAAAALVVVAALVLLFPITGDTSVRLTTGYGEQQRHALPDGTVVTLNANSSLRYLAESPREVVLEGEAFFEVSKKPETGAEFRVQTADLTVTVLGTVFNVNTRNQQTKVYLKEGRVDLQPDREDRPLVKMSPGDVVTYSRSDRVLLESSAEGSSLSQDSWKDGNLLFSGAPLPRALQEIEAVYGGHFEYPAGSLDGEVLTGAVPITDLQMTLNILREVYGLTITVDGDRYKVLAPQD